MAVRQIQEQKRAHQMTKGSTDLMANSPSQGTARLHFSNHENSSAGMNTSNINLQHSGALRLTNRKSSSPRGKMAITFAQMKEYRRRGTFYQSEMMHSKSNKSVGKEVKMSP